MSKFTEKVSKLIKSLKLGTVDSTKLENELLENFAPEEPLKKVYVMELILDLNHVSPGGNAGCKFTRVFKEYPTAEDILAYFTSSIKSNINGVEVDKILNLMKYVLGTWSVPIHSSFYEDVVAFNASTQFIFNGRLPDGSAKMLNFGYIAITESEVI